MSSLATIFLVGVLIIHTSASAIVVFPVRDTDGNPVNPGVRYQIVSVLPDQPGAVIHELIEGNCPDAVTLRSSEFNQGFPIGFYPNNSNEVMVSEKIYLEFFTDSSCGGVSSVWKANGRDDDVPTGVIEFLSLGGDQELRPFSIEEVDSHVTGTNYKLLYCPVCLDCPTILPCYYVGIYNRRLALVSDDETPFEFKIEMIYLDSN